MTSRIVAPAAAALLATMASVAATDTAEAQSGKWVASVQQLKGASGSADLTVESRNDKQSRARITFRNTARETRIAWDIVQGRCGDNGAPIAPQAAFTQVMTQMDGSGTASANIPKLESGKQYYVRVFDPQSQPTDGVGSPGCANLSEKPE